MESAFAVKAPGGEAYSSGVSWPAVVAGGFVSAALALTLLALGTGLGLSSVSPWSNEGASAATLGTAAIAWLVTMQVVASGMGGYLAGRLRTKWATVHTDEVYFRDTAHGFLVWAVGLVITVYFLSSAATAMVGGTPRMGTTGSSEAVSEGQRLSPTIYFVDTLFRSDHPGSDKTDRPIRAEAERVFVKALGQTETSAADQTYLGRLVAAGTGMSEPEAGKRVSDVMALARQAADSARKAVAHSLLWIFVALLIGAFCASYAATIGGRQRDHVKLI